MSKYIVNPDGTVTFPEIAKRVQEQSKPQQESK